MSTLKELTQDATTEPLQSRTRTRRAYSFFLFYQPITNSILKPVLQKMAFKLQEEKPEPRVAQLQFYNIEQEAECTQGLLELRQTAPESKPKIIAYCEEERLLNLLDLAMRMGLDLANIPIILAYPHPHSDFAAFTGWNSSSFADLGSASAADLQRTATQWIQAAQERVDVWTLSIAMHEEGHLQRQTAEGWEAVEGEKTFQRRFLSHVSLGYHVRLSKNYREKCKETERQGVNRLIYGWESFKNFCCLRPPTLRAATGVLSINYRDEKGDSFEILKRLRDYDGSEEEEKKASRVIRNDHGILSLVVANIDRYHGNKLDSHLHCKPGDGHLQILLFEGPTSCRRIASVGDQIVLKVDSEAAIDIQVGEAVYRCFGCRELRIRQSGRIRAAFNRQLLHC